jgi:hypothetical protein
MIDKETKLLVLRMHDVYRDYILSNIDNISSISEYMIEKLLEDAKDHIIWEIEFNE